MRKVFPFLRQKINWFPGHMVKATYQIKENIDKIDTFVEVRDSRLPFTSSNKDLGSIIPERVHRIVLYNKCDLVDHALLRKFMNSDKTKPYASLQVSSKLNQQISKLKAKIKESSGSKFESTTAWVMIGGIPNVGKSTIINSLRKLVSIPSTAKSGAKPCLTRGVSGFKISESPSIYMLDTPGLMPMRIESEECGMKMLACGLIKDGIVDNTYLCDYILFMLNKSEHFSYTTYLKMKEPCDDINELLLCVQKRFLLKSLNEAEYKFLRLFRDGKLAKIILDDIHK